MSDHLAQFLRAFFIGRDLRLEIAEIVMEVARRVRRGGEKFFEFLFTQTTLVDQLKLSISTPSSSIWRESGGIEPGVLPPISA